MLVTVTSPLAVSFLYTLLPYENTYQNITLTSIGKHICNNTFKLLVSRKQEAVITLATCVRLNDCNHPKQTHVVLKRVSTHSKIEAERSMTECGSSGLDSPKGKSVKVDT